MKESAKLAAREMRQRGASVAEIIRELRVSKGSVCNWTSDLAPKHVPESVVDRRKRNRENAARRYEERRKRVDEIKLKCGCVDCGYKKHPAALQFDHVDSLTKSFKIASSLSRKWDDILTEINKCTVRCAICHAIKTVENEALQLRIGRPRAIK